MSRTTPSLPRFVGVFAVGVLAFAVGACSGARKGPARGTKKVAADVKAPPTADRDLWQRPDVIVEKMALGDGMRVIDLGAGSGYMMPWLAAAVSPTGTVMAVEIDPTLVSRLQARKKAEKLGNVQVLRSTVSDLPVSVLVDRILLLNTYPELADPVGMLAALRLRLRPAGRLIIIDYRPDPKVPGPPVSDRLPLSSVVAEARGVGFALAYSFEVLPRQYMAVFVPAEELGQTVPLPRQATPD